MERIRRKLASADDGNRQIVDILSAVLTDGLPAVNAACAEAITHGVHSADVSSTCSSAPEGRRASSNLNVANLTADLKSGVAASRRDVRGMVKARASF